MQTQVDSTSIEPRFEEYRAAHPRAYLRDAARDLRLTEAALVAAGCGLAARRLEPDWDVLFAGLPKLGRIKTITRNDACVLEKWGNYGEIERFGSIAQALGDIDLRLFTQHWDSLFAVRQDGSRGARDSLQLFDTAGDAVHKVYREPESDETAWWSLVECLSDHAPQSAVPLMPRAIERPAIPEDIDAAAFCAAWDGMQDTHDFFGLLSRFGLPRVHAMSLAGRERAEPMAPDTLHRLLQACADAAVQIMIFVGNRGMIQIHKGVVNKIVDMHGYLNVLDPGVNLHVKLDRTSEAWIVRKPTALGVVTSFELYEPSGETAALVFGKREPDARENPAWREIVEAMR